MSTDPTWYLGPLGDLRPLTCPEPGVQTSVVRSGGVHQALSGARTVDVTGHSTEYQFDWSGVQRDEWLWLDALHVRVVPGPFAMIDPLKKNRLSLRSSKLTTAVTSPQTGIVTNEVVSAVDTEYPSAVGLPVRSLLVQNSISGSASGVHFDKYRTTAVRVGEQLTCSVWARRTGADPSVFLDTDFLDSAGAVVGSFASVAAATTSTWARFSITNTVPAGAVSLRFAVLFTSGTINVKLAAPQIEVGATPTSWEPGGGTPRVSIDQLSTSSPRFPLTDCSMTLLEA